MSIQLVQKVRSLEAEIEQLKKQVEELAKSVNKKAKPKVVAFDEFEDMSDVG
jgi:cell division protein FtsB